MKKILKKWVFLSFLFALSVAILVAVALFGLSHTRDFYACNACKSIGESKAIRVFRFPIWKEHIRVTRSVTWVKCKHKWRWYFANSAGILFNRENWDGPIGNSPNWYPSTVEWTQNMDNKEPKTVQ